MPTADPLRQRWLSILAQASSPELEAAWDRVQEKPALEPLRRPETGLVMLRGRIGGGGQRFNLGEMTVTRCAVRVADGTVGHGYVQGRDKRKAELVAAFDVLLQDRTRQDALVRSIVEPLARAQAAAAQVAARKAASTKVEFFTLVRGDD